MEALRTPDDRFTSLPGFDFSPRYGEVADGAGGTLRMHYLDEGPESGPVVVLMHGEPSWCYLYRSMIPVLTAAGFRCIAPDLIGFGRSDKPTDIGWYSYDRHVDSIARLVEELDLTSLTLVVHDWGGPIGLRVAVEHPERIARLVILNTGIGGGRPPSETWLRFRAVVRELGGEVDIGRLVEAGTSQGLSDEIREAYDAAQAIYLTRRDECEVD